METADLAGAVEKNKVIRATSPNVKLAAPSGKLQIAFGGMGRP